MYSRRNTLVGLIIVLIFVSIFGAYGIGVFLGYWPSVIELLESISLF